MEKLPKAGYSSDDAGAMRGFVVESKKPPGRFQWEWRSVEFTPHTHAASFGVVFEGECELVIDDESKVYRAGDVYYVPESARHFARQAENYKVIVIFNEPGRVRF